MWKLWLNKVKWSAATPKEPVESPINVLFQKYKHRREELYTTAHFIEQDTTAR